MLVKIIRLLTILTNKFMVKRLFFMAMLYGLSGCCEDKPEPIPPECNSDCSQRPDMGSVIYNYGGTVYLGGNYAVVRLDSIGEAGVREYMFCNMPDSVKQNGLHIVLTFQPKKVCPDEADGVVGGQYAQLIYLYKL